MAGFGNGTGDGTGDGTGARMLQWATGAPPVTEPLFEDGELDCIETIFPDAWWDPQLRAQLVLADFLGLTDWRNDTHLEPPDNSAFIAANVSSTSLVLAIRSSSAVIESLPVPVASSRAPEAMSSSMAPARACIDCVLSSARWMAIPTSPSSSEMPEKASLILVCASAAE